jgi:hypothetical protein
VLLVLGGMVSSAGAAAWWIYRRTWQQPSGFLIEPGEVVSARVKSWGTTGRFDVYTVIDTSQIRGLANSYRLLLVSRAEDRTIDGMDDIRIDRSSLFSIRGTDQTLQLTLSQNTMQRLLPSGAVNLYVFLVPAKIDTSSATTGSNLLQAGAYLLGNPSMVVTPNVEQPKQ